MQLYSHPFIYVLNQRCYYLGPLYLVQNYYFGLNIGLGPKYTRVNKIDKSSSTLPESNEIYWVKTRMKTFHALLENFQLILLIINHQNLYWCERKVGSLIVKFLSFSPLLLWKWPLVLFSSLVYITGSSQFNHKKKGKDILLTSVSHTPS